jgi:acyl-CoA synthetase (AMP-forming)/AMP-acid ligase II
MSVSSLQPPISSLAARLNVADRLATVARVVPEAVAVATPGRGRLVGGNFYVTCTFAELDADATALARGLVDLGVRPGARLVLLVPPGVEFVKLVFAMLRSGATTVLIDPGMGRRHLVNCLAATQPEGFIAVSRAQAVRFLLRRRFPRAAINVTVGRRWFWSGPTYSSLMKRGRTSRAALPSTQANDPAAIIFTSGSTGPPKGVLYTHRMFDAQVEQIQRQYAIEPGGVDLACFALFGLFNSAMGVTTVFPDMDFSRPASADPRKLLAAANDWQVTQAFASPVLWDTLSRHCEQTGERISSLSNVFSCGAPVPAEVIRRTLDHATAPGARMHTPYGATEALPVSTIEAREILRDTAVATSKGAGVCVGRKFDAIEWRVIRICDEPIATIDHAEELPTGEIGELIVRGPQVSPAYVIIPKRTGRLSDQSQAPSASAPLASGPNALWKIHNGDAIWHRMGDVGYLDSQGRFWYCGRKSHRVETGDSSCFSTPYEEVFNAHPRVKRSALVGLGTVGAAKPVLIIELVDGDPARNNSRADERLVAELRQLKAAHRSQNPAQCLVDMEHVLVHPKLPVDVRHNAKINREMLAAWAQQTLSRRRPSC